MDNNRSQRGNSPFSPSLPFHPHRIDDTNESSEGSSSFPSPHESALPQGRDLGAALQPGNQLPSTWNIMPTGIPDSRSQLSDPSMGLMRALGASSNLEQSSPESYNASFLHSSRSSPPQRQLSSNPIFTDDFLRDPQVQASLTTLPQSYQEAFSLTSQSLREEIAGQSFSTTAFTIDPEAGIDPRVTTSQRRLSGFSEGPEKTDDNAGEWVDLTDEGNGYLQYAAPAGSLIANSSAPPFVSNTPRSYSGTYDSAFPSRVPQNSSSNIEDLSWGFIPSEQVHGATGQGLSDYIGSMSYGSSSVGDPKANGKKTMVTKTSRNEGPNPERRRKQHREHQRAFRERKMRRIGEMETRLQDLKAEETIVLNEIERLKTGNSQLLSQPPFASQPGFPIEEYPETTELFEDCQTSEIASSPDSPTIAVEALSLSESGFGRNPSRSLLHPSSSDRTPTIASSGLRPTTTIQSGALSFHLAPTRGRGSRSFASAPDCSNITRWPTH